MLSERLGSNVWGSGLVLSHSCGPGLSRYVCWNAKDKKPDPIFQGRRLSVGSTDVHISGEKTGARSGVACTDALARARWISRGSSELSPARGTTRSVAASAQSPVSFYGKVACAAERNRYLEATGRKIPEEITTQRSGHPKSAAYQTSLLPCAAGISLPS